METEIKKKEQTMMCAEYLKFKDKNMKINNDRPTLNNIKIKSLNNQMVSKRYVFISIKIILKRLRIFYK